MIKAIQPKHMSGLHYHRVQCPVRLCSVPDSGNDNKKSCCPYEGEIVLLMNDSLKQDTPDGVAGESWMRVGGYGHALFSSVRKGLESVLFGIARAGALRNRARAAGPIGRSMFYRVVL